MSESGEGEVIIGETHFLPEETARQEPTTDTNQKPPTKSRFGRMGDWIRKGYGFLDAPTKVETVPVQEIDSRKVAEIIRNYRLEVGRFNKYDSKFAAMPFSSAGILNEMGYKPNWEVGKTDWRNKYPEAYDAVRRGIDDLIREGALNRVPTQEGHPDNEQAWYQIANESTIRKLSLPQPQQVEQ